MKNYLYIFLTVSIIFFLKDIDIFSKDENYFKEIVSSENIMNFEREFFENEAIENLPRPENNNISQKIVVKKEPINTKELSYINKEFDENNKYKNYNRDNMEVDNRTNRVTALGSAMGAVDLSNTPTKKIRVGAGVGSSTTSQAVAVGIGYAPTENLKLNTKVSTSTSSSGSHGISVGASYDLDW